MPTVEDEDERERIDRVLGTTFVGGTPHTPFGPRHPHRLLLYPIDYVYLSASQFSAVGKASQRYGADHAYAVGYESPHSWGAFYGHTSLAVADVDEYRSLGDAAVLEHCLFATDGSWGVVTSHGDYAIVGGQDSFIDAVRRGIEHDPDEVVGAFLRDIREMGAAGIDTGWATQVLGHLQ